jgi:hypothetical protein
MLSDRIQAAQKASSHNHHGDGWLLLTAPAWQDDAPSEAANRGSKPGIIFRPRGTGQEKAQCWRADTGCVMGVP